MEAQTVDVCPECHSEKAFRDGTRTLSTGKTVQRYSCRACGYRYTEPNRINNYKDNEASSQIGAKKAKNLVTTTKTEVVGDNTKINQHLVWMANQGYKPSTIERRQRILYGIIT